MKRIFLLSATTLSLFFNCRAQQVQQREVSAFTKIEASGAVDVVYTTSDTLSLGVKADNPGNVETKIVNGTLIISNKGNSANEITVYVKNNRLNSVEVSGATDFKTTNILKTDSIVLNATGASDIHAEIETRSIRTIQSGASDMVLKGTAEQLNADLTGASSLKAYHLQVKNAAVISTGASTAKVNVNGTIMASASGASDIKIKGDPKEINANATTAAKVSRVKENPETGKNEKDTTTYNWKGKKFIIVDGNSSNDDEDREKKKRKSHESSFKHWKGVSIGVNGYLNPAGTINMTKQSAFMDLNYARSFNWQFNLIEKQVKIVRHHVKLVTGFGIDYHMYELARKTTLNADSSFTTGMTDSTGIYTYKKNKLRATYLQVPLLLEFNTSNNPDKSFHIAFGVIGQYLVGSRTRQVLMQNKYEITKERKDSYNLSPFAAKAHVNLGYRGWTVFGEYSLTPLFSHNKGPELYPFAAGIRVVPFS